MARAGNNVTNRDNFKLINDLDMITKHKVNLKGLLYLMCSNAFVIS